MAATEQVTNLDPSAGLTWNNFEQKVTQILSFPWNKDLLRGQPPEHVAKRLKHNMLNGFIGVPRDETFTGPMKFFRGVGSKINPKDPFENNAYANWWFPEAIVRQLEVQFARIFFTNQERKNAFSDTIRAGLAIAYNWNKELSEYWMLELPAGAKLTGLIGAAKPQSQYSLSHPNHDPNKKFPGGLTQAYFPLKNPLWIRRYW